MIILGLSGGLDSLSETNVEPGVLHDAAAVLIKDGQVIAGVEQERVDRIKHSNKRPTTGAINYCLEVAGITLNDVDRVAYYFSEASIDRLLMMFSTHGLENASIRQHLVNAFRDDLGYQLNPDRIDFIEHHYCHEMSCYGVSGFDDALVLTLDGFGDNLSTTVSTVKAGVSTRLKEYPLDRSLGHFYLQVTEYLGYRVFDEYKVMGLAPYGDPSVYRNVFQNLYRVTDQGEYEFVVNGEPFHGPIKELIFRSLYMAGVTPRKPGGEFTQQHKDVAAAAQEALENIVLGMLRHYQKTTDMTHLCMAGGVALNCTMNGKILNAGLFEDVFIQPAAGDSGNALGAALAAYQKQTKDFAQTQTTRKLQHVYWGKDIGDDQAIEDRLGLWDDFINVTRHDNVEQVTAERIASGQVIGWVQGRSEFGPRALGNRSILADPRPADNKHIINKMVKKREGYRPFAPSILQEELHNYYECPKSISALPYMLFILQTKQHQQAKLGAVTHVDGTARVQTVSKQSNPRYWNLINAFNDITGVPILLNTSFNNNVEPIVDSVDDSVSCFLTTDINCLVIGNYVIDKKPYNANALLNKTVNLPHNVQLRRGNHQQPDGTLMPWFECHNTYWKKYSSAIAPETFLALAQLDGTSNLNRLIIQSGINNIDQVANDIETLWQLRALAFS